MKIGSPSQIDWHVSLAFLLSLAYTFGGCEPITAWWTTSGPSVAFQHSLTKDIIHSLCNNVAHMFPPGAANFAEMALETSSLPRHGTALAATGWFDEQGDGLFVSYDAGKRRRAELTLRKMALFYLGLNDDLVHDTFECDLSTGRYVLRESEKVLDGRTGGMHADTRLSVVSRDKEESYQLFYHDETGAVVRIAYTRTQGWHSKDTVVDSSVAGALSAYWHDTGNISVATLRDSTSFRISEITAGSTTWQHCKLGEHVSGSNAWLTFLLLSFPL